MTDRLDASQTIVTGVHEGDVLAGKYRIEKVLGAGGMGVVVAAYHVHLDEKVAIKFLLPEALVKEEVVARFAREARAAVKIKSEHVARVLDVGTLETGAPYLVMEYLEGTDLSVWVQQRGALPIEQAVEFILHACEAIADAHSLGIIHRDLKPANLFCVRRSDGLLSIKVLDFGISKLTSLADSGVDMSMTKTTSVLGSPLYMSPEQMLSSRDVDVRTDIWALGVILYELLVGKVPFNGDTLAELCVKIATMPSPPLRDRLPDAPLGLQEVIQKCMEKDRTKRYASIADFAFALAPFAPKRARASIERVARVIQAAGLSASALDLPPSSEASRPAPSPTQAAWGQTNPATSWKRAQLPLGVILLLAGAVAFAAWLWSSGKGAREVASATSVAESSSAATAASAPMAIASAAGEIATSAQSGIGSSGTPRSKSNPPEPPAKAAVVQPNAPARNANAAPPRSAHEPKANASPAPETKPGQPAPDQCVPACRTAQVCVRGQCVSACNPPCASNEVCTPKGACVSACNPPCPPNEKCLAGGRCVPR